MFGILIQDVVTKDENIGNYIGEPKIDKKLQKYKKKHLKIKLEI